VTAVRRYYRGRNLVAVRDVAAGQNRYYHFDHQGTTQCLTDQSGAVTDRFASDAWGVQVKRTGTSINRQWYVGQLGYYRQVDQALDYVRARYLAAARARWVSRDPIVQGNFYSYVAQRPIALVDPTGLVCEPPGGCKGPLQVQVDVIRSNRIVDLACDQNRGKMCLARGIWLHFVILNLPVEDAKRCGIIQWAKVQCKEWARPCRSDTNCRTNQDIGNLGLTVDSSNDNVYYSNVETGEFQGHLFISVQDQLLYSTCHDKARIDATWELYTDVVDKDCIDAHHMTCQQWAKIGPNNSKYRNCFRKGYAWTGRIFYDPNQPTTPDNPFIDGKPPLTPGSVGCIKQPG
jgi:RHS repeat-associated protein